MMRSMFSAVSGLRIHQTRMDVIAHNLANVNTTGFKSSRTNFADVFSQTLQGASQANEGTGRGGTNPMQVGLGANLSAIDRRMTQGAAMRTDVPLDLMIQGEGFFIVGDATGQFFSRAGAFRMDPTTGWLVNDQGMPLQGWNADENFDIRTGQLETIVLDRWTVPAQTTSFLEVAGNLDITRPTPPPNMTVGIFDSLGTRWTVDAEFIYVPSAGGVAAHWRMEFDTMPNGDLRLRREGRSGDENVLGMAVPAGTNLAPQIFFDSSGNFLSVGPPVTVTVDGTDVLTGPPAIVLNLTGSTPEGSVFGQNIQYGAAAANSFSNAVVFDFSEMTQFSMLGSDPRADRPLVGGVRLLSASGVPAHPHHLIADVTSGDIRGGMRAGNFDGISVGPDGIVRGRFTNGEILQLAQIPIAIFRNPAGLEAVGNNLFVETANSGAFDGTGQDVSLAGSAMMGGVLEMSNVDLAAEFTDMIITQRGFQSNSRIITVSDEMLQILNNL